MKKQFKKSVLGHSLAMNDRNCLYLYRFSASGYVFNTVERFLLVCSSMTAGCSVTLEFIQINMEKKRQWSQALSKQPGCSPCLVNNLVTSYVCC